VLLTVGRVDRDDDVALLGVHVVRFRVDVDHLSKMLSRKSSASELEKKGDHEPVRALLYIATNFGERHALAYSSQDTYDLKGLKEGKPKLTRSQCWNNSCSVSYDDGRGIVSPFACTRRDAPPELLKLTSSKPSSKQTLVMEILLPVPHRGAFSIRYRGSAARSSVGPKIARTL